MNRQLRSTTHILAIFLMIGSMQNLIANQIWFSNTSDEEIKMEASIDQTQISAVYQYRWKSMVNALNNLDAITLEAEVLWDKIFLEKLKPLRKRINLLNFYIKMHIRKNKDSWIKKDPKRLESIEDTIYRSDFDSENNRFEVSLKYAIKEIEDFIRPKLKN